MANKAGAKARRLRKQAAAEALIRFGPELSGLRELQRSAQGTYKTDIRNANQTALGIAGAARVARPEIRKVYERAGGQLTNTWNQVAQDIGAPGTPQSAIQQALVAENAAARSRLREGRVESYRDMTNRIVGAQEGRAQSVRAARGTLASELGKVQRRRADVLREKGAFTASTLSGLLEADLDRQTRVAIQRMGLNQQEKNSLRSQTQQERNSMRSSGRDPDTGKIIPGGPLDPDANKVPGNQQPSAGDVSRAEAKRVREQKRIAKVRKTSIKGVTKVQDAAALWKHYSAQTDPDLKRRPTNAEVEAQMLSKGFRKREVDIARDLLRNNGRLSARGVRAMRELGWRTPARWRPRPYVLPPGHVQAH